MRLKERIPLFLEKVDWEQLINDWFPGESSELRVEFIKTIKANLDLIREGWKNNPDLRIGQVLVNNGIIMNIPGMWYYDEERDILFKQGYAYRDILFWGKNFDKDMNRLPKTEWALIKDLETDHIKAILSGGFSTGELYTKVFKDELKLRAVKNNNKV